MNSGLETIAATPLPRYGTSNYLGEGRLVRHLLLMLRLRRRLCELGLLPPKRLVQPRDGHVVRRPAHGRDGVFELVVGLAPCLGELRLQLALPLFLGLLEPLLGRRGRDPQEALAGATWCNGEVVRVVRVARVARVGRVVRIACKLVCDQKCSGERTSPPFRASSDSVRRTLSRSSFFSSLNSVIYACVHEVVKGGRCAERRAQGIVGHGLEQPSKLPDHMYRPIYLGLERAVDGNGAVARPRTNRVSGRLFLSGAADRDGRELRGRG